MKNWSEMNEVELVEEASNQIWLSSFAANNPRAPAHKEFDNFWRYCCDNDKQHLYQRAWNKAYEEAGYIPSEREILAAEDPK